MRISQHSLKHIAIIIAKISPYQIGLILFICFLPLYLFLGTHYPHLDFANETKFITQFLEEQVWPANFLGYLISSSTALFQPNHMLLLYAEAFTFSFFLSLKYVCTVKAGQYLLPKSSSPLQQTGIILGSLILQFTFSIPFSYNHWYFGTFPPNIWHNPSTNLIMPLSILITLYAIQYIQSTRTPKIITISLLSCVSVLIKPSFFFCFAVAFPLLTLLHYGFCRKLWHSVVSIAIPTALVILEYFFLFQDSNTYHEITKSTGAEVIIAPFKFWIDMLGDIPLWWSIVAVFTWPVLVLSIYGRLLFRKTSIQFSLILTLMAFSIMILFTETGARAMHGNFTWQMMVCNFILYISLFWEWLNIKQLKQAFKNIDYIILAWLIMQSAFGILYLARLTIRGSYS